MTQMILFKAQPSQSSSLPTYMRKYFFLRKSQSWYKLNPYRSSYMSFILSEELLKCRVRKLCLTWIKCFQNDGTVYNSYCYCRADCYTGTSLKSFTVNTHSILRWINAPLSCKLLHVTNINSISSRRSLLMTSKLYWIWMKKFIKFKFGILWTFE